MLPVRIVFIATALLLFNAQTSAGPVSIQQGDIARWSGMNASSCGYRGRLYPAVDGVCYYPTDMKARPGRYDVALYDAIGQQHVGYVDVGRRDCTTFEVTIKDERYVKPQGADLDRHLGEYRKVIHAINPPRTAARFSLPLGEPATAMPKGENDFCFERRFNGLAQTSTHTGRDYPVGTGTPLLAPADGTVLIAADHFMTGNAVYIDHGDGLVTEFFHLSELDVAAGDQVKKGQTIGKSGEEGRASGPHLHLGVRWANQRIDPGLLFTDPSQLPDIGTAP